LADLAELAKGLPPTIPIFWRDSYKTTGDSKILRVAQDEKKHYYVVLDETIFYPKAGVNHRTRVSWLELGSSFRSRRSCSPGQ